MQLAIISASCPLTYFRFPSSVQVGKLRYTTRKTLRPKCPIRDVNKYFS